MSLDMGKARLFYPSVLRYLSADDPQRAIVMLNLARASHGAGELEVARELFEVPSHSSSPKAMWVVQETR